jgi:hypothetical protein
MEETVRSFVYLGDKLNTGGESLCVETARIHALAGWKNFKESSGVLCGRKWSLKLKRK